LDIENRNAANRTVSPEWELREINSERVNPVKSTQRRTEIATNKPSWREDAYVGHEQLAIVIPERV
jgi:hypothetical protein